MQNLPSSHRQGAFSGIQPTPAFFSRTFSQLREITANDHSHMLIGDAFVFRKDRYF
jgi:hypothetical protein